jgi:penicillin-binding protein 1A
VDAKKPVRAVSSDVADAVMVMLQNVVRAGTGAPAGLGDRAVAGKTGTAEGARDLWFIGSIPQLTTAIWFGYDENYKTGSTSATSASAWHSFMSKIVKDIPPQPFPPKPELTGTFIPYVPPKKQKKDNARTAAPVGRESSWEAPPEPDAAERRRWEELDREQGVDARGTAAPSLPRVDTWEPREPSAPAPRSIPAEEPAPRREAAAPAPAAPAPAPEPAAPPPLPTAPSLPLPPPPPPIAPPPPL